MLEKKGINKVALVTGEEKILPPSAVYYLCTVEAKPLCHLVDFLAVDEIQMCADGLPNTFVPGRNLLFFITAGALAYRRGLQHIVGGMCETDYSGYPDCRDSTIKAMQVALTLGMDRRFVLHTPLMWMNKAETWALADRLGGAPLIDILLEETHTCYTGNRTLRHDWGYGCGACPACELRAAGYERFRAGENA